MHSYLSGFMLDTFRRVRVELRRCSVLQFIAPGFFLTLNTDLSVQSTLNSYQLLITILKLKDSIISTNIPLQHHRYWI